MSLQVEYSWIISNLECRPVVGALYNVVDTIHWRLVGTHGNAQASVYGSVSMGSDAMRTDSGNTEPASAPGVDAFTPYEELTEQIVVGWLEQRLDVPTLKQNVQKQIEDLVNPPTVSPPLPWSV